MQAACDNRSVLVVNFNAPELNALARELALAGRLAHLVRTYVNKGRAWERALQALPLGGPLYAQTLGRRRLDEPALARRTREAGVLADWCSALAVRAPGLPPAWRHACAQGLHQRVREAVAREGALRAAGVGAVVAYEGFGLAAFERVRRHGGRALLSYPVAHHRRRAAIRDEELEREPSFAATWPGFDDWPPGHEQRLDEEVDAAHAVLLGSEFAAESFVACGVPRHKLRVVPYGVDHSTFHPGAEEASERSDDGLFRVIFSGQLTQRKGLSYLLKGYAQFHRPDSRLTLVGSVVGSREPLVPWRDLFEHVPHQTRPALAEHYRRSDVFVLPTLVEGMPLVVLEAMACGLPVIVTANGPADIVRDGIDGFVIPERNASAVAEKLAWLHQHPQERRAMGQKAAARAREFGWPVYGQGVMRVLDEAG